MLGLDHRNRKDLMRQKRRDRGKGTCPQNFAVMMKKYPVVPGAPSRGGGFFHSKGTWGCAAREGILFRPSSLAKGVLFGNFNRVKSRQGYAFWEFWSKRC